MFVCTFICILCVLHCVCLCASENIKCIPFFTVPVSLPLYTHSLWKNSWPLSVPHIHLRCTWTQLLVNDGTQAPREVHWGIPRESQAVSTPLFAPGVTSRALHRVACWSFLNEATPHHTTPQQLPLLHYKLHGCYVTWFSHWQFKQALTL